MRAEGLEPPSLCGHRHLNRRVCPFHHARTDPPEQRAGGLEIVWSLDDGGTRRRYRAPEPEEGLLEGHPADRRAAAARLGVPDDRDLDRRWDALAGAKALQLIYIGLYLVLAFFVVRWSRGVLPLIAALAIVLFIFALVSVPGWFERDKDGFTDPAIASDVIGLLTRPARAAAAAPDRVLDARLPAGLERRGRAARRRRRDEHGDAAPAPA